jgi:general secretion pathway protein B
MSFILDALKKSESDRQRQSGPSLFEVKVAPPRRSLPIWAVAIAVLLAINVIVISWMLFRQPSAQQRTAASPQAASPTTTLRRDTVQDAPAARAAVTPPLQSPATAGQTGSAPAPAGVTPPPPAARTGSPEQPSAPPPAAGAGSAHDATPSAPENPGDYAPAVEPGAPGGSAAPDAATADLPLYQQIVTSDGLPALHLDLHVFADRPQDRFAMINMHRVREGDSLPGGTHVEAIRPDGVVLTYRGTRFLLPRN